MGRGMSEHDELAEQREQEAERLQERTDALGEDAQAARSELDRAQSDELVPEALGEDDPAHGTRPDEDPEEPTEAEEPEAGYPSKR
jgi:hypothetical protein